MRASCAVKDRPASGSSMTKKPSPVKRSLLSIAMNDSPWLSSWKRVSPRGDGFCSR